MSEAVEWFDDSFTKRVDVLTEPVALADRWVSVANTENFRPGDLIRLGDDDLYDTGEVDEDGRRIMAVRNEVVRVFGVGQRLAVIRGVGINPVQEVAAGGAVTIIGTGA